jgi:hypothetical protein
MLCLAGVAVATQLAAELANFSNLLRIHLLCLAGVAGATQLAAELANFSIMLKIHMLCLAGVACSTQLAAENPHVLFSWSGGCYAAGDRFGQLQ